MVSRHGAVLRFEFGAVYPISYCPVPVHPSVTLPNLLLRIAVAGAKPQINAALVLMSAVASPMSEKLLFRGYLFG